MIDRPMVEHKAQLIKMAIDRYSLNSMLDVGACWGVHGGYSIFAVNNGIKKAIILDGEITDLTIQRTSAVHQIELRQIMLGDRSAIESLPYCDAAVIFDVLLHQVDPDWDEFIQLYSEKTDTLIIYNQDYIGKSTIRYIDMGKEWYKKYGFSYTPEQIDKWFARHDQICPEQNKKYRDVHNYWQWGIVAQDIIKVASDLDFRLDYCYNHGPARDIYECHAYIFRKRTAQVKRNK